MFTAIYIEFFSLHRIDLKLTTLSVIELICRMSESVRAEVVESKFLVL